MNKEKNYQVSEDIIKKIHKGKHSGATSTICIAEILSGFFSKNEKEKGERFLTDVMSINNFKIIDVDLQIAKESARVRGMYKIKLPDAMVIATCRLYDYILLTNDKRLWKIKEIQIKTPDKV
ncbi:MAG: PIN domain-containing protein [Candidatus Thermoplasmatota archaeon]|nr:PIN domain-containing protein [Candidatus Thermoplasmatota archaeon]MBU4190582.1 PIN domain-containing protein [Candidatus Thermoplasmatota archaeon]MCG2826939.1 PIN domain-containing protein [Thermoplasmatales archaeon]